MNNYVSGLKSKTKYLMTETHSQRVSKFLLVAATGTLVVSVGIYVLSRLVTIGIPDRFVPSSLLIAITPAFTILLVYELIQLATAVRHTLVEFVKVQFEIISLLILRDLFKQLDTLNQNIGSNLSIMAPIALTACGCLVLYFLIEIMERMQQRYTTKEPAALLAIREVFSYLLLLIVEFITVIYAIGWLFGVQGYSFDKQYFSFIFSIVVVFNVLLLFIVLFYLRSYEVLFEYSALILASVIVLIAIPMPTLTKLPLVLGSAIFSILTLMLHGFVRGKSLYKTRL